MGTHVVTPTPRTWGPRRPLRCPAAGESLAPSQHQPVSPSRGPPGTTANGSTRRPRPMRAARSTVAPSLHPHRHVPVAGFRHPPMSNGGVLRPPCIISPTFIYALVTLNMPLGRKARHFVSSFKCTPWPYLLVVQQIQIFLILWRSPIQSLIHITIVHALCTDLHPNLINASWAIYVKSLPQSVSSNGSAVKGFIFVNRFWFLRRSCTRPLCMGFLLPSGSHF